MSEDISEFQQALHDALESKRLSATHVQRLTESGTRLLKHDHQLVAHLYQTLLHLPPKSPAKISLLYCTDALARAVRSLWRRASAPPASSDTSAQDPAQQQAIDPRTVHVAESFLGNLERILPLFTRALIAPSSLPSPTTPSNLPEPSNATDVWTEGTDKTRKILEIWRKNSTFGSAVMDEVEGLVKAFEGAGAKRLLPGLERLVTVGAMTGQVDGANGSPAGAASVPTPPVPSVGNNVSSLLSLLAAQATPASSAGKATPPAGFGPGSQLGGTPPYPSFATSALPVGTPPVSAPVQGAAPSDFTKLLSSLSAKAPGAAAAGSPSAIGSFGQSYSATLPTPTDVNLKPGSNLNDALAKRDEIARRLAGNSFAAPAAVAASPPPPNFSMNPSVPPPASHSPSTSASGRQLPIHPDRLVLAHTDASPAPTWGNPEHGVLNGPSPSAPQWGNDEYAHQGGPPSRGRGGYGYRGSEPRGGRGGGGWGSRGGGRGGYPRDFGHDQRSPPAGRPQDFGGASAPIRSFEDSDSPRRYGVSTETERGRAPLPPPRAGKDEFGRDITDAGDNDGDQGYKRPRPQQETGNDENKRARISISQDAVPGRDSGATNTQLAGPTLETFDWKSFNPSDGSSWATLGEAWKRSNNGREPAQQELMMAFMSHSMGGGAQGQGGAEGSAVPPQQQAMMAMMMNQMMTGGDPAAAPAQQAPPRHQYRPYDNTHSQARVSWDEEDGPYASFGRPAARGRGGFRGRGRGRGGFGGAGDGYGGDNEYGTGSLEGSDAVVLGGGN